MGRGRFLLTLLCCLSLGPFFEFARAYGDVFTWISATKDIRSGGDSYSFEIDTGGSNIKAIMVSFPNGSKLSFKNTLGLTEAEFNVETYGLTKDEFESKLPEGTLRITYSRTKEKKVSQEINYANKFPEPPTITYPPDGAVHVPSDVTLQWSLPPDANGVWLNLWGSSGDQFGGEIDLDLPASLTSYSLQLLPGFTYEMTLCAEKVEGTLEAGISWTTCRVISFTTED